MGESSAISWTDHTFNPWMGCSKVSPGCDNCYAEALGKRTGRVQWGDDAERVVTSDGYWRNPIKWNAAAEAHGEPAFVFCASLADVFEDRPDVPRDRLWNLIEATPWLIWLLLTKRPENIMGPNRWLIRPEWIEEPQDWPHNVWIGTTVEDQQRADLRIPLLADIPAPVRFLSCEPLLGPVEIDQNLMPEWVIIGGESGPHRRDMNLVAFADLLSDCRRAGVPVWVKQDSGLYAGRQGRIGNPMFVHERPTPASPSVFVEAVTE